MDCAIGADTIFYKPAVGDAGEVSGPVDAGYYFRSNCVAIEAGVGWGGVEIIVGGA